MNCNKFSDRFTKKLIIDILCSGGFTMRYQVLARRYRPKIFQDVVGQEAIITTLKNALRFNRVAHAYLFCGSRGVGKTTLARIFAKALNCNSLRHDFEPCNECTSCQEILAGQSLDVIEIDGASNRGIDDIRQLNETIGYAPSHGKYKIYIIDEVHMLTKEAFNALLKTLEEPPERAKFFFATTEPHKVLPTIVSRCQRFDLQRLMNSQIVFKLQSILSDLKREASSEAIHLISTFADGSLRDAESLLDQILCFTDEKVEAEQVRNILGLVPDDLFFEFDLAFSENRIVFAFELVERLFQMGKDLGHFLEQLIGHYRHLALAKMRGVQSLNLPESLSSRIHASANLYTQAQLFYILEMLLHSFAPLHKSPMQRVTLESILLQVLRSKNRIPIEVLIRRLDELEQKLSGNENVSEALAIESISPLVPPHMKESVKENPVQPEICLPKESVSPIDLKEVPFNPCKSIPPPIPEIIQKSEIQIKDAQDLNQMQSEQKPLHSDKLSDASCQQTNEVQNQFLNSERNITSAEVKSNEPGRFETLLRFAAVELEGKIKT